jgi:hypothetical protein
LSRMADKFVKPRANTGIEMSYMEIAINFSYVNRQLGRHCNQSCMG